jgi:hypothetical protein
VLSGESQPEKGDTLAGASVSLSVAWDVMPVSGAMRSGKHAGSGATAGIVLPSKMCSSAKKCKKMVSALGASKADSLAAAGAHRGSWMEGKSTPHPHSPPRQLQEEL